MAKTEWWEFVAVQGDAQMINNIEEACILMEQEPSFLAVSLPTSNRGDRRRERQGVRALGFLSSSLDNTKYAENCIPIFFFTGI